MTTFSETWPGAGDGLRPPSRHGLLSLSEAGELCAHYTARLRDFARRRAGAALLGRLDADDLVQETVLEALRRFRDFRPRGEGAFFCWLASLAEHRICNLRRREFAQRRSLRREVPLDCVPAEANMQERVGAQPFEQAVLREQLARCEAHLDALPAADAAVVRAVTQSGRPLEVIADEFGRSKNAMALRLSRALRQLRARCAGEFYEE